MQEDQLICEQCNKNKLTGECICDLGLDMAPEDLEEQVPMEAEDPSLNELSPDEKAVYEKVLNKQKEMDPIMAGFKDLEEKPSEEQIEMWKKQHGKIYTVGLNEDEYFIFRPLRRLEWRNLMKAVVNHDEMKKKEVIFQRGILWPKVSAESMAALPAGTPETVYEMILQASNFLLPQEALACVRKL